MTIDGAKHIIVEFVSTGTAPDGTSFELPRSSPEALHAPGRAA